MSAPETIDRAQGINQFENLTPLQQTQYEGAVELAYLANACYDTRLMRAEQLAALATNGEIPDRTPPAKAFKKADEAFNFYNKAASALMPAEAAFYVKKPSAEEAPTGVEALLSPEQRTHAETVVTAMAETFGLEKENVRLVLEETKEHGKRVVAIDASPNGKYVGSYRKIAREREANPVYFMLDIDGEPVDVLAGTTDIAYRAMIADAKARGVNPLPDSRPLSRQNGEPWTATMLTGEDLTADGDVQVRDVDGGKVYGDVYHPDGDDRGLRVRPAVVVAQLES